ncbi:MAG: ABC transporter substrate-binding protein [Halolamina sp.]
MRQDACPSTYRRALLAGLGTGTLALSSGCLSRVRRLAGWRSPAQVELQIKTLPADADPYALQLARTVATWFGEAGIDATVVPMAEEELLRQTLLQNEFDLFVMRLPGRFREPDALTTLLHSQYADAPGWQNPLGYANLDVDELLETQRRSSGRDRREALEELQLTIARTQPFTMLPVPDEIRAARTTAYTNWRSAILGSPLGYLMLDRHEDAVDARDRATLNLALTDQRATTNLNPLSVEFRRSGILTGLLYDPLGYTVDGDLLPWLAQLWTFTETSPPVARLELREGMLWHDDEPLTAQDVAFTYELLADTTLGSDADADGSDPPVPSPRFRGRTTLVETARAVDETTVEIEFVDADPSVAARAFTVPILPEHIWRQRTDSASIGGIDFGLVTDALVTNNIPPVGSGPLQFVRNTPREAVVFERFDSHFLNQGNGPKKRGLPEIVGRVPFERLAARVVGSDVTAVEMVASQEADVTAAPVGADTVPRIGRNTELELLVTRSEMPYILGYNTRRPHLNNPRVRNTLARLVDQAHLTASVLQEYGRPAAGPLWDTRWYPDRLEWDDGHPVTPFLGDDGDLDVERAREAFRETGYRYNDGRLIGGNR